MNGQSTTQTRNTTQECERKTMSALSVNARLVETSVQKTGYILSNSLKGNAYAAEKKQNLRSTTFSQLVVVERQPSKTYSHYAVRVMPARARRLLTIAPKNLWMRSTNTSKIIIYAAAYSAERMRICPAP